VSPAAPGDRYLCWLHRPVKCGAVSLAALQGQVKHTWACVEAAAEVWLQICVQDAAHNSCMQTGEPRAAAVLLSWVLLLLLRRSVDWRQRV
jgi:hypothetical protein